MPFHCMFALNSPLKTTNIVLVSDSPANNLEENAAHHSKCSHIERRAQPNWCGPTRCLHGLNPEHRPNPHSRPSAPLPKFKRGILLWCPVWTCDANPFGSALLWVTVQRSDLWRCYYSRRWLVRDMLRESFMWSGLSYFAPLTSASMCISVAWVTHDIYIFKVPLDQTQDYIRYVNTECILFWILLPLVPMR